ncbi:MAG: serine/threonine-protein kinase [Elainellaceae cyanobacterium]
MAQTAKSSNVNVQGFQGITNWHILAVKDNLENLTNLKRLMAGQILGDRYEVQQQLGKKSGRWTLLARDLTNEALVILKLVFVDDELKPDDLKLFKREAEALKSLKHPSTPEYLGSFEMDLPMNGKAMALVQSYIQGKSLDSYLKEGRNFTERESKRIAREVLKILEYLHSRQPPIIHRDIKPSNVLLVTQPGRSKIQVFLVDFGSVKSLSASENTSLTLVGTRGYMPPEQVGGRTVRASDIYGLGVTLVTCLTGIEPSEIPSRGMRLEFETITDLSPDFTTWLKKMVHPALDRRFATSEEAMEALRPLM